MPAKIFDWAWNNIETWYDRPKTSVTASILDLGSNSAGMSNPTFPWIHSGTLVFKLDLLLKRAQRDLLSDAPTLGHLSSERLMVSDSDIGYWHTHADSVAALKQIPWKKIKQDTSQTAFRQLARKQNGVAINFWGDFAPKNCQNTRNHLISTSSKTEQRIEYPATYIPNWQELICKHEIGEHLPPTIDTITATIKSNCK